MNRYWQRIEELAGESYSVGIGQQPVLLSEEELQAFEQSIGYSLPMDYREFLKKFSGYTFFGVYYPIQRRPDLVTSASLGMFYGFKIGSTLDLLLCYQGDLNNMVIAPELLPIACDRAGNQVCIFLDGPRKGTIHFWLSDRATAPYDYSNLYPIADSFDEFMTLLHPMTEEDKKS